GAGTLSLGTNSSKFTGLEPVTVLSPAATVQIDVDPANTISGAITTTLADAAGANMIVSFTSGLESLTFATPTVELKVVGDNVDNDVINVASVDAGGPFRAALTLDGQGGADTVTLAAALTLGAVSATGNVTVSAETINLNANISTNAAATAGFI